MDGIGSFIFTLHSLTRWAVVIVAIVALVAFALVWARRLEATKPIWNLQLILNILIDIQVLLGLITLIGGGISAGLWTRQRFEHAFVMIIALVVAHLTARWKKADAPIRARNNVLAILGILLLVFVGVASLGGNRWVIG